PDESTVTLVAASTMTQVWNYGTPEQLLCAIADAISYLGSIAILGRTPAAVVLGGEHAELLRASGWGKRKIREFVVAQTGRSMAGLVGGLHGCGNRVECAGCGRRENVSRAADTLHHSLRAGRQRGHLRALACAGARREARPAGGRRQSRRRERDDRQRDRVEG